MLAIFSRCWRAKRSAVTINKSNDNKLYFDRNFLHRFFFLLFDWRQLSSDFFFNLLRCEFCVEVFLRRRSHFKLRFDGNYSPKIKQILNENWADVVQNCSVSYATTMCDTQFAIFAFTLLSSTGQWGFCIPWHLCFFFALLFRCALGWVRHILPFDTSTPFSFIDCRLPSNMGSSVQYVIRTHTASQFRWWVVMLWSLM